MILPEECKEKGGRVKVPRGEYRSQLSAAALIGKVQFTASMSEMEVRKEICRTFATPLGINNSTIDDDTSTIFPFLFLQSTGQGTCSLCVPTVSQSFAWTGQEVAALSKQGKMIYLLAQKSLPCLFRSSPGRYVTISESDDDDDELPEVSIAQRQSSTKPIEILDDYPSPCSSISSDLDLQAALEASRQDFVCRERYVHIFWL